MTIRVVPREGALYQDGYTEDGEPFIKRGTPYFAVVVDERLGRCDYELDTFGTLAEAEVFAKDATAGESGRFCRCDEEGY